MTAHTPLAGRPTQTPGPAAVPVRHVERCMGTVFSIDVRAPGVCAAGLARAVASLHHIDAVFSPFRADSAISRLRARTATPADVPAEVRAVLDRCAEMGRRTDGYFSAYYDGLLDPSGYVKGWAVERASDVLTAAGSRNHCVNGGGDVQCVGDAAPGRPWRVGITDPLRSGHLCATVSGSGRFAVATTGTSERGEHVIDPHTGRAPTGLAGVTVVGTGLAVADAYATAAFAMGPGAPDWLAAQPGLSSTVTFTDGRRWQDPTWPRA